MIVERRYRRNRRARVPKASQVMIADWTNVPVTCAKLFKLTTGQIPQSSVTPVGR